MEENPLSYARLSLHVAYCRKCENILKLCYTSLKSPASKKYRISIGLCKYVFINLPIVFLDGKNKTKLVPASFLEL